MADRPVHEVSERVATQYEHYMYPTPLDDLSGPAARARTERADPKYYGAQLWPEGPPRNNLRILSAGCGTNQAAHLAYNNPDCSVLGIDLSEASIANQRRLADKHALKNLKVEQRNILDLGSSAERFDLIVCTGVLHHMAEPQDGMNALASVLSPQGVIYAMLYASSRRAGIYFLQDLFRRLGAGQNPEGIALVRQVLNELPPHHYARWFLPGEGGQYKDEELVDIFLHPQDRAYSVQDVLDLVAGADLMFQGWHDNGLYYRDANIDPNSVLAQRLAGVSEEDEWSAVDDFKLHNIQHNFMARHKTDSPRWRIDFDGNDWLTYRPAPHPALKALGNGSFQRGSSNFSLGAQQQMLLQACDGQTSIATLAGKLTEPEATADKRALSRAFFRIMWRLGHVFFKTA